MDAKPIQILDQYGEPINFEGGEFPVIAGARTKVISFTFGARPANTTQYTANDVVSDNGPRPRFSDCVRKPGGGGRLLSAMMFASTDASTNPSFDLILFDTDKFTYAADNAAGTVTDAEVLHVVACITFDGTVAANVVTAGPNLIIGSTALGLAFRCAEDSQHLWGMVVDRGGYTPASGEVFGFKIAIDQD